MTVKTEKESFKPAPVGDSTVTQPLQNEVHKDIALNPTQTSNIVKGNEVGAPNNIVKVSIDGKEVNAVQTMGTDGTPHLTYNNVEYSLDQNASKSGSQVWKSDDGQTITQTRGRSSDNSNTGNNSGSSGGDTSTGKGGSTGDSGTGKPTEQPASTPVDSGTTKDSGATKPTDTPTSTTGGGEVKPPVATTPDSAKTDAPISTQPVSDAKTDWGKDKSPGDGGHKGGGEEPKGGEGGGRKGGGEESRGSDGGRKGGSDEPKGGDSGGDGGGRKGGSEGGDKSPERGESKPSIPERSTDKPVDKPADKPAEKPESGSEKSPLEKIDLSTREGRRELFEALKSAREVLDGKTDLKSIDPKQRALVEELMKLDQSRSEKLFGLLSQEFQGKGSPMSDSAYMFNLRTLLGLEKLANPTQPAAPIPGLSPELAKGLYDLFKMYTNDQNAQRSTLLGQAYKFSVDYNNSLGLDKNGLTSRDVLVALNTMAKEFGDLAKTGQPGSALASKETLAQILGKDTRESAQLTPEQAAKLKELSSGAALAEQTAIAQKLPEGLLRVPPTQQDGLATGKVEGQILKDMGAKADALTAQQHALDQAASTAKTQPNQPGQPGQKDPLTAEQKELSEREQGPKKKPEEDREDIAHRLATEAAIAASLGGRATTAEINEGSDDDDKKKQDEKEARRAYKTKQGDTLEMIAETQLKSKTAATLIYNINKDRIPAKVMGNLHIISMRPDMELALPTPNEVKTFKGPYLQFQYREFASAEEELAFWQKFLTGQEPGHSSLFDKFGMGQGPGGAAGVSGVDDSFAVEAFTAAQRQSIRNQLGMSAKETVSQSTKTVRYGESIRKFTARTLFDEALWELVARKNNLPVVEDNKGEKTVRLKSYQKLILPSAAEIKEFKQGFGGPTTPFEMVSRECPKCRRLVRQNESVCPPPCFYAFVETGNAADPSVQPIESTKDEEQPKGRLLRRRRTTGFIPEKETKPAEEVPSEPFENEVISTVLKAAGLSSAAKIQPPTTTDKIAMPASGEALSNPSRRGVRVQEFDPACRVVLTPKDREGRKFERKLEVLKDGTWVTAVLYEIGAQESFVTEFDTAGAPRKQRIDLPFEPAMELSENHLNEAWKEYRQEFLGE